jgi:hypothetical protein
MSNVIAHFSSLTDPRVERTKEHLLEDIIFIMIAAVICGCENWNDIESYGYYCKFGILFRLGDDAIPLCPPRCPTVYR